jgi:LDH2 family malate/lactate/ureidoglycolate dehydrogenase
MANDEILVIAERLQTFLTELFGKTGIEKADAAFIAQTLVKTNLWGIDSHGAIRAPIYFKRFMSGVVNQKPSIHRVRGAKGFEVLDGDNGHGFVVGRASMVRAMELAKAYNVGAAGAIRSNHFGAAGVYARMAADQGMIGIAMSNMAPLMAVPGASQPVVGNNPIAVAVPTGSSFPIVWDIALSTVTVGKLLLANKKGEKIPLDWATDSEGHPTDDPAKALSGFLLPIGAHKGFGLAVMIEILCGVVMGGSFLHELKSMVSFPDQPSSTCHLMIAVNLTSIISQRELESRMSSFCETLKRTPMWDPTKEILVPGEIEHRTHLKRAETGIPIPKKLYEELVGLGREVGLSVSL